MTGESTGENQFRLQALLDLSPMPISWADLAGNILYENRKFIEIFGYTAEDIPTIQDWYLRAYPDPEYRNGIISIWESSIEHALKTNTEIPPIETCITCKDGSVRKVSVNSVIVHDTLMAIFSDLTEHKRVEEALRHSENFLSTIIDESPHPMWIADTKGTLIRINRSCCRLLGITEEDVLDRYNVFEDPLVIEQGLVPTVKRAFEQGEVVHVNVEYEASHLKHISFGPCPRVYLYITLYPIKDANGNLTNVAVQHIDMTERTLVEEALRKSEERFRRMAERLLDVMFQTDTEGFLTYLSPSVIHVLGWAPEEMIGKHVVEFVDDRDAAKAFEKMNDALAGVPITNLQLTLKRKDGATLSSEISGSRLMQGDIVEGVLGLLRDVTERKQAEKEREKLEERLQQAQKMEAVGQLAGGIAHDFNNLLQVILGHVDLIQGELGPENACAAGLDEVHRAAERAADLTRQLLAFSRRQIISPVDLDLNELIQGILKMIHRVIGEHIELSFMPGNSLNTVHVDRGQIEQVLMNLCVNARDAMPNGGGLTIKTENVQFDAESYDEQMIGADGWYVMLSVTDTGCGMDETVQEQIFDPFFTTKEVGQGTGLGLATVYGIVKQHDGLINVYSELDKGTMFKVYLPAVARPAEEIQPSIEKPVVGGSETILLAEDEESVRTLSCHMLRTAGYTVLAARNGEEALRLFAKHPDEIDLALLDVIMPKLGGKGVMERIQTERPTMRFLFCSGYDESAIHTNFVIKEGLHLIMKPYRRADLLRAIRTTLDTGYKP